MCELFLLVENFKLEVENIPYMRIGADGLRHLFKNSGKLVANKPPTVAWQMNITVKSV